MREKITLKDAIKFIEIKQNHVTMKGWEYLGRFNDENYNYLPTKKVVDKFKEVIGDKWDASNKVKSNKTYYDLLCTNIIIDGHYILASGGLCPSGVRLFDIIDHDKLNDFVKNNKVKIYD